MKTLFHLARPGATKPFIKSRRALAIVLLLASIRSCLSADASTNALRTLTSGNTAFALDVYQQLKTREGNLFFSPFSLSSALAMTHAGARGQTASEMARVLHFMLPQPELIDAFGKLNRRMTEIGNRKQVTLSVANSLWTQPRYHFEAAFLELNRKYFDAKVGVVDFDMNPGAACREINDWIAKKTADKIKDLIAPDGVGQLTRLVLCNAIYFKGDWEKQFDPQMTHPADFIVSSGRIVQVPMMFRKMKIKSHHADDVSAFELRYTSGALSMIVLLPDTVDGLGQLESRLDLASLARWLGGLSQSKETEAMVFIPKFKSSSKFDLVKLLVAMGMPAAFELHTADFSGMTGHRELFISAVTHAAFVEVNEQGTEAAAATAVVMTKGFSQTPIFRADHPFLFLIRENQTGSILFLGRVVDPTK